MPRKSIYDVAALAVVIYLASMALNIGAQMLAFPVEPTTEGGTSAAQVEEAERTVSLDQMTRKERDRLRDRDGVVWGMHVDWASLYPPKDEPDEDATVFDLFASWVESKQEGYAPYKERVSAVEQYITNYATGYAPNYQDTVESANRYDELIGWDIACVEEYNPVIMAEDNYFITCVGRQDRSERASEIVALDEFCKEHGMEHLYVTTPNDACRYDEGIANVVDFYNQNADRLQRAVIEAGVDTIDLRNELHDAGLDHHSCFYQTDHHWLPETGRWAAGVISQRLNDAYGFTIDTSIFEPEQWRADVFHDFFLGTQGKKVTLARSTPEDFKLFYPKFRTRFHIEIPSLDLDKTGSFSVFYRYNVLRLYDFYTQSAYSAYFYGDRALTRVHNLLNSDGRRVLVLGHSFDNCVLPFLAAGVEYLDSIDLREFTGDLETYLEKNSYDIVIEIYTE